MRIALIRQRYTAWGGAENTLAQLAREFVRQGQEVTILASSWQGTLDLEGPGQVRHFRVPVWGGKSGRTLSFALNCRRLLQKEKFEVIYSLERTLDQDVYRAGDGCHREWLARRWPYSTGVQRFALVLSPFHRLLLGLEKRLFRSNRLRLVIANSRQVQNEVSRHYRVAPEKIRVIYNGIARQRFSPDSIRGIRGAICQELGISPTQPIILFVGSGFYRKGLVFLIQALARLKDRRRGEVASPLLLVIGQGRTGPYQRLAQRLGIVDRVRFLGPQLRVERFYAAAAVVALPTIYDPCSNVVLEALACGRPVITTAANGAAEFIKPGENGIILSRPDDLEGLAAALEKFQDSRNNHQVEEAAVQAVAGLSWSRTAQETLEALSAVAAQKRPE